MSTNTNSAPNLAQRPPRSSRVRLGGHVILPSILDKGRAELAGTAGEYKYNNPMDRHWFRFTCITPEALKADSSRGRGAPAFSTTTRIKLHTTERDKQVSNSLDEGIGTGSWA